MRVRKSYPRYKTWYPGWRRRYLLRVHGFPIKDSPESVDSDSGPESRIDSSGVE